MSEIPKCTSWLGHRFRPRYSRSSHHADLSGIPSDVLLTSYDIVRITEAEAGHTYEGDVCVRCGCTVTPPIPTERHHNHERDSGRGEGK